jgi:hypothetical protein
MGAQRGNGGGLRGWRRTAVQLANEMWLPFAVAFVWTGYNVAAATGRVWTLRDVINLFGPTFFFAAWLISQWLPIRRQHKVEDELGDIAGRVRSTLDALDEKTQHLAGLITGGESACHLHANLMRNGQVQGWFAIHHGEHPIYDAHIRVVDLDELKTKANDPVAFSDALMGQSCTVALLTPHHASVLPALSSVASANGSSRGFNIFVAARNGDTVQRLRYRLLGLSSGCQRGS